MSEKVVNAALLGLGTVGTGVYKVIKNQEQEMTAKLGRQVKITKICSYNRLGRYRRRFFHRYCDRADRRN